MPKGTVNKVILIGRLGADPELKYTPSGVPVATFNIATDEVWKDKDGNPQERTEWHRIVTWQKQAELASEYLKKGHRVYIEGRLQTRSWEDKDNVKRWTTEVVARHIEFLESRGSGAQASTLPPPSDEDIVPTDFTSDEDLPF